MSRRAGQQLCLQNDPTRLAGKIFSRRLITVALFKKKNQKNGKSAEEQQFDAKLAALEALNAKLNGTLYDNCIIMPRGYTIDITVPRNEEHDGIHVMQVVFVVRNDDFDEPLIDPVDAQGKTPQEAVEMAAQIFFGGVWHTIDQASQKKNGQHLLIDYLGQHYEFDMYAQSVVRIGVEESKQPTMLVNLIKNELARYIGSKKYYWVRIYMAKFKEREIIEVRVNGSVCVELKKPLEEYLKSWGECENFVCEKQYAIFVQTEDDQCPFTKETVMKGAKYALEKMVDIKSREDYEAMANGLLEEVGDKSLAAEIRIFIPEILAKMTLGYREGDSLFIITDAGNIEIKKTQLRSYFYLQQAILEFLNTRPPQEAVQNIVFNSVAFREMRKAMDAAKEQGKEIKPDDLFVPGTSYKIAEPGYKVW